MGCFFWGGLIRGPEIIHIFGRFFGLVSGISFDFKLSMLGKKG